MLKKRLVALTIAGSSVFGGLAVASPAQAHNNGSLVDIEVSGTNVVLLSGINVSTAANVCGVNVGAIQLFVIQQNRDINCTNKTRQLGQLVVISKHGH
jgi:hypothetical protein